MEVTQQNFEQCLKKIEKLIEQTQVISFDLEMTGIRDSQEYLLDLPIQRYMRSKKVAEKYRIIQVGLCFYVLENNNCYTAYPFNFYVFPQQIDNHKQQIVMDVQAVHFNSKNNMNWQKWITQGVSYANLQQRKKFKQQNKQEYDPSPIILNDELKKIADKQIEEILNWRYNQIDNSQQEFIFQENRAYLRKYNYQYFENNEQQYQIRLRKIMKKDENGNQLMIAYIKSDEKEEEFLKKEEQERQEKYDQYIGFSKIMKLIKKTNKKNQIQYVGHNCMMDILFMLSHFQELPNNYQDFKDEVKKYFPNLFDTKLIFNQNEKFLNHYQGSRLEDIKNYLDSESCKFQSHIKVIFRPEFNRYTLNQIQQENHNQNEFFYHEAGYDALLTGYIFLQLKNILNQNDLTKSLNQLNLYQSVYILNLHQKDSILNQKFIIFATKFLPKEQSDQIADNLKKTFASKDYRVIIRQHYFNTLVNVFLQFDLNNVNQSFKQSFLQSVISFNNTYQNSILMTLQKFTVYHSKEMDKIEKKESNKQ